MSNNLNLSINISSYAASSSNGGCGTVSNPQQVQFKWQRSIQGIPSDNVLSQSLDVPVSSSVTLFTGSDVHKFLYLETNSELSLLINGTITIDVKPLLNGTVINPGVFMVSCDITSVVVTNASAIKVASVFYTTAE